MSAAEARQLALFLGEPAGDQSSAGREPVPPPEGFKPDLRRGLAWCPYCAGPREFAWDAETGYARCPECGVSAEDFYTKTYSGLWPEKAMREFVEAVRAMGRPAPAAAPPAEPTPAGAEPRPGARSILELPGWAEPACPECGRPLGLLLLPARVRCQHCGSRVRLDGEGEAAWEPPQGAARCRRCGRLLEERPRPGAAYFCWFCALWSAAPADRRGEREAEAANAARPKRRERKGPLPGPVLAGVRELVGRECANYQAQGPSGIRHYCALEAEPQGACAYFSGQESPRCRWLEEGILTLDPALEEAYWREYAPEAPEGGREGRAGGGAGEEAAGKAKRAARKAAGEAKRVLEEERKKREKICPVCRQPFLPKSGFDRYCCEEHKKKGHQERKKAWREGKVPVERRRKMRG